MPRFDTKIFTQPPPYMLIHQKVWRGKASCDIFNISCMGENEIIWECRQAINLCLWGKLQAVEEMPSCIILLCLTVVILFSNKPKRLNAFLAIFTNLIFYFLFNFFAKAGFPFLVFGFIYFLHKLVVKW